MTTSSKKPVILISGATATGKTSSSLCLADAFKNIEIVNFDSLLFFKELNIGTAKPTPQERAQTPHHMIDVTSVDQEMNASQFCKLALPIIDDIHARSKVPLLVGGSAFYIRALIKGMYDAPAISSESLAHVQNIKIERGNSGLRAELKRVDPESFDNIHENDLYRTTRALEFYFTSQKKFSAQKALFDDHNPYDFENSIQEEWSLLHLYMSIEKSEHWEIMLNRTKEMIESGLISEVENLLNKFKDHSLKPLQSIGYKETISYLSLLSSDSPMSVEELISKIYISTRRLAKSQKTFFNKISPKTPYHPINDREKIIEDCSLFLSSF